MIIWVTLRWKVVVFVIQLCSPTISSRSLSVAIPRRRTAAPQRRVYLPFIRSARALVAEKGLCPRSCARRSASQRVLSALFRPRCTPSRFISKIRATLFRPSRHAPNIDPLTRVKSNPN